MYRDTLSKVPFFADKEPQFIATLVILLRMQYFAPGDVICRQGQSGDMMYFVGTGTMSVRLLQL